ncbi:MAG: alpha/beta hydrolase [Myxococcota bacterium]
MAKNFPVLFLHGFTSSLDCIKFPVQALRQKNFSVSTPVLRGHNSRYQNLRGVKAENWYEDAEKELLKIHADQQKPVMVAGLSMGGLVTINLALKHPEKIHCLALAAPALIFKDKLAPLAKYLNFFFKYWKSPNSFNSKEHKRKYNTNYSKFAVDSFVSLYKYSVKTRNNLDKLNTPFLVMHSFKDQVISHKGSKELIQKANSDQKNIIFYSKSGHELYLDLEKDKVVYDTVNYFLKMDKKHELTE